MKKILSKITVTAIVGFIAMFLKEYYEVQKAKTEQANAAIESKTLNIQTHTANCYYEHLALDKEVESYQLQIVNLKTLSKESRLKRIECDQDHKNCEEFRLHCDETLTNSVNNECVSFLAQHEEEMEGFRYVYTPADKMSSKNLEERCDKSIALKKNYIENLKSSLKTLETYKYVTKIEICRSRVKECREKVINCIDHVVASCPDLKEEFSKVFDNYTIDLTRI